MKRERFSKRHLAEALAREVDGLTQRQAFDEFRANGTAQLMHFMGQEYRNQPLYTWADMERAVEYGKREALGALLEELSE